ncbi:probable phosphoglycerate mutase [Pseudoxanthobacter soli DSM 19599]|uniref:Probable phosphoglycerate mutase n=1 Tax=Pseudoxanthobacter soli DSM 19599 TaxID=1123029 RepID=A0A1M7ZNL7_9HYPH|nr:histidine phosphatase family protein [Pseudoxanthobacter soli]SHO66409.1 probable phosphoglycerate mutase [Pseudoxanthobacter soli DSM 19599]
MTTFYLVRHAAHDSLGSYLAGRMEGVHLGPAGREQAERLARRMQRETFAAIVSSPRERTRETAMAISVLAEIGPVEIDPDLDEIDFGAWSGKTFDELNTDPAWRRWNEDRASARTPNGESMDDVGRRVLGRMDALRRRHDGETVVLVTHADVIKAVVCHTLGLPADRCFRFEIDPASITVVADDGQGARLIRLNEGV